MLRKRLYHQQVPVLMELEDELDKMGLPGILGERCDQPGVFTSLSVMVARYRP